MPGAPSVLAPSSEFQHEALEVQAFPEVLSTREHSGPRQLRKAVAEGLGREMCHHTFPQRKHRDRCCWGHLEHHVPSPRAKRERLRDPCEAVAVSLLLPCQLNLFADAKSSELRPTHLAHTQSLAPRSRIQGQFT